MKSLSKSDLLDQIAQINLMERGSLSKRAFKDRPADAPPQFKLQSHENGKNFTRHVTTEQLPLVREALEGYAKFQSLTGQLADLIINQTREQLQAVRQNAKKKTPRRRSSSPKTRKSRT